MKIKQLVLVIILILSLIGFLAPALFAAEIQTSGSEAVIVTTQPIDGIRADNPGILQTNPFYFIKEWKRGIQRVFTFNPVSRLQYDFQVATDKAAELKRLEEISIVGNANLRAAIINYSDNLRLLPSRLLAVHANASVDVLNDLILRTLKQDQFLEELKSRHVDLKSDIEAAQVSLHEILEIAAN